MLRIHFTPRDLARVTVATKPAPLWKVLLSLHMLQQSDGRLIFEDWRRTVRTRVAPDQMLSGYGSANTRQAPSRVTA